MSTATLQIRPQSQQGNQRKAEDVYNVTRRFEVMLEHRRRLGLLSTISVDFSLNDNLGAARFAHMAEAMRAKTGKWA